MAGSFLEVFKSLLAKWHCDLVATLRRVLNDEVVEGSKPGRNFVSGVGGVRRELRRRLRRRWADVAAAADGAAGHGIGVGVAVARVVDVTAALLDAVVENVSNGITL